MALTRKEKQLEYQRKYLSTPKGRNTHNAATKRVTARLRLELLGMLGGGCVCCHETQESFLEIDHVFNDGWRHGAGSRARFYKIRRDIQDGNAFKYQVLCANCHTAKTRGVICPHREDQDNGD